MSASHMAAQFALRIFKCPVRSAGRWEPRRDAEAVQQTFRVQAQQVVSISLFSVQPNA